MNKRTSRKDLSKDKSIDLMKPLQFDKLGGDEDPCFGKLHDPTAGECQVCGDAEICSIVFSQKLHIKRDKIEEENSFKDMQTLKPKWKDLSIALSKQLKPGKKNTIALLRGKACKSIGITESIFDKLLIKLSDKSKKFKIDFNNNIITRRKKK